MANPRLAAYVLAVALITALAGAAVVGRGGPRRGDPTWWCS
ncbi:MAG: hypothetical protein RXQ56_02785 [Thermoproteus sp.]